MLRPFATAADAFDGTESMNKLAQLAHVLRTTTVWCLIDRCGMPEIVISVALVIDAVV
jgi:hypothetical protein